MTRDQWSSLIGKLVDMTEANTMSWQVFGRDGTGYLSKTSKYTYIVDGEDNQMTFTIRDSSGNYIAGTDRLEISDFVVIESKIQLLYRAARAMVQKAVFKDLVKDLDEFRDIPF